MKYEIEELIEIFEKHAIKNEEQMKKNRENHSNEEWTKNDFNLCKALYSICCEIQKLKDEHETNQPKIPTNMRRQESQNPQSSI